MITRRQFIRNATLAAVSLPAQKSKAIDNGNLDGSSRVLLVYNAAAQDGLEVANYYKANRPGMSEVDTLAITADTTEQTSFARMISQIRTPIYEFVANS